MAERFCSIEWAQVAKALQALLTPAIGIATVVVAVIASRIQRQQAETNRRQYRLALFEKRMKVFEATQTLIATIIRDATIDLNQLFQFLRETRDASFLFGPEIVEYMDDLYRRGTELRARELVNRQEDIERRTELPDNFARESARAAERFMKYVDFREP